ncbi:MAG: hypothetical protein AAB681_02965 [Patescibacteria group bacterium]|mgnify:CR=1 FL=1
MLFFFLIVRGALKPAVTEEPINETPIEEVVSTSPSPKGDTAPAPVYQLPYTEAVAKYKGSRIQFDQSCQAIPSNQTFKVGTSVMIDNRSPKTTTISFGSSAYLIEAYGYTVVSLTKEGLFTVNCNEQRNVLTLSVQK